MRAVLVVLALALLVPASAAAATLPSTNTRGVKVAKTAGGRIKITFANTAAGRSAYRPLAGRRVTVRCQHAGDLPLGSGIENPVTTRVRLGKAVSTIRLRLRGTANFCTLGSVTLGLDTTARRFMADLAGTAALTTAADLIKSLGPTRAVRRLRRAGARLTSPAATPRAGRIGVYSRGGLTAVAMRSASGRRLFLQQQGDVVGTNTFGFFDQLGEPPLPRGVPLPSGDVPPAGTPLPATTDDEVTATRNGSAVAIDFSGSARDGLEGRRVGVSCNRQADLGLGFSTDENTGSEGRGPAPGRPLRVSVDPRYHVCLVSFGGRLARVALDDTGRRMLEEGLVLAGLLRVLRTAADDAAPGYPSADALSAQYAGQVAALAAPTDTPPDLRIGAWSDGARRLTLTATARTGKRLFIEVDGLTLRSSAFVIAELPNET